MNAKQMLKNPVKKFCLRCKGEADTYGSKVLENTPCPKCGKTMMSENQIKQKFPNTRVILGNIWEQYKFYMRIYQILNEVSSNAESSKIRGDQGGVGNN